MKTAAAVLMTLLRVALGAILLFSGIAKVDGFGTFVAAVESYHILPAVLSRPASYLLLSAEITLGIAFVHRLSAIGGWRSGIAALPLLCIRTRLRLVAKPAALLVRV